MNVILLAPSQLKEEMAVITNPHQLSHIKTVLKAKVGDALKIGVLGGKLGVARIDKITEDVITLDKVHMSTLPPAKIPVTVVLALPRPKVLRRLMMDMAAVGVAHIVLVNSYRTDKAYWQSPLLARLDEFLLEGLAQGVDTVMPQIQIERRFKPFVEDRLAALGQRVLVAHPYADTTVTHFCHQGLPDVLIVGAEGGFIPYEIELLKTQGVSVASLGARILRTEAAVNALLGRWMA
ncbi:MAG: 16S rRNA (uracil(1498)-N(3))-methyltransferase [Moraxella sp.]|nr:16S rRNA (uracil(1498)-N(3))-methyltransferase [Moraxella sp.]